MMVYQELRITLAICAFAALGCAAEPERSAVPQGAEMLFWERQSWETGGGLSRLTIWKDGRSEILVVPDQYTPRSPDRLRPRQGWTTVERAGTVIFIREPAFRAEVAREKFHKAFEAGIHLLETFRPDYVDGEATLVGTQIDGQLKETVIPMFTDKNRGTENHMRFLAVSEILAQFDTEAYDLVR